jgi:hypothetical protein
VLKDIFWGSEIPATPAMNEGPFSVPCLKKIEIKLHEIKMLDVLFGC